MKILSLFIMFAGLSCGTPESYHVACNFVDDLGGSQSASASRIQFNPPAGYRVRILGVHGDFIAWPLKGEIASGTYVEVGWGLKTTIPDGSSRVTYPGYAVSGYDNTCIWKQNMMVGPVQSSRLAFDEAFTSCVLESDNVVLSQAFVAMNSTGLVIHMEPTFVIDYRFEAINQ